ncbi:MAG: 30S ribosomal protein S6 [Clostridia bacterium]|nr:30S ribosomal protein S6 [Clostridia bacterium]
MRKYEMLYILSPELTDEGKEAVIKKLEDLVVANGGNVIETNKWGMKKLQYPIQFKNEGYYVLMTFEADTTFVQEMKRIVGISEGILRRLITRV